MALTGPQTMATGDRRAFGRTPDGENVPILVNASGAVIISGASGSSGLEGEVTFVAVGSEVAI